MTHHHPAQTDDRAIPAAVRRFLRNRLLECGGFVLLMVTSVLVIALASWSIDDPSRNHTGQGEIGNLLGYPGAVAADELMRFIGLASLTLIAVPLVWSAQLFSHRPPGRLVYRLVMWLAAVVLSASFLSCLPVPSGWVLGTGLGGSLGDLLSGGLIAMTAWALKGSLAAVAAFAITFVTGTVVCLRAVGTTGEDVILASRIFGERGQDAVAWVLGSAGHLSIRIKQIAVNLYGWANHYLHGRQAERTAAAQVIRHPIEGIGEGHYDDASSRPLWQKVVAAVYPGFLRGGDDRDPDIPGEFDRLEPRLDSAGSPADAAQPAMDAYMPDEPAVPDAGSAEGPRVTRTAGAVKQGKRVKRDSQPGLKFSENQPFELPPVTLLTEPKAQSRPVDLSDEALQQNARMLEGVLEDFGIRGEIINVHPGPVVTLYELEPAPGIKSSRVIGLADDIARSMSAISARVAVVPGRNAIGIELPNSKRETVYLREMLGSAAYEKTKQHLALALGKNIGGEPVFADLARMPHLLIAGTTGSGKSVGINTMILSLLYRHSPESCKLIMIDPKMLELSVYEGIPHLLAPVVTDPHKAVVALKWAVREMEERYRNMSKLGVRNVDGFNARVKQALKKGEVITRTVQTGYDPETGEPVYEQEEMDLAPMPYIVVIIDEMADLMMVAGKDIEGAVQRLAQMARAAGIHVVMATQRPSVDVITGTIKANFPTRISFQVTSKIDSRTILGEQGAEQLLGQGDMLYMAGGGRIVRLHGPFVADDEVEQIVTYLKSQGAPEYVEAVTEESPDDAYGGDAELPGGGSGDELYDKAVAVVLRDKKVSTSYIQRRLQIGYNRAASLIERMEQEGLISPANHAGKREILVGSGDPE